MHEVVKDIKENGVIEIEAPYSRRDKIRKYVLGVHNHQEKKDKEGRRARLGAPLRALSAILQVSCSPSFMHEVVKNIKENGVIEIEAPYSRRVKMVNKKMLQISWCDESKRNTNIIDHLLMDVGQHLLRDARTTQMTASTDGCCYDEGDE
ncbi:hypothetical protein LR48_Vigan04g110600 [Vigna angularis]|uniref:Uncharacterized protein n=1 Tax=Phaseolus angularis TaxID=3914 RepID=A0A0L9UDS8_PHAAN|nr:hypothetical protein LR48_Vigan04g110600 [Vigna angularis]